MGSTRLYAPSKTLNVPAYCSIKKTKTIYLFLKALRCLCGTILSRTGNFVVNACAKDKSRLQS